VAQISLPLRVALAGALAFIVLWFIALRPKDPDAAAPTAPGVTGLGNAADSAADAASASDAASAAAESAAGAVGSEAGTSAAGARAATDSVAGRLAAVAESATKGVLGYDPSLPLLKAVDEGRVVVLLFWSSKGVDDRAARDAVRSLDRRGGRVVVRVAPVGDVGKYEAITRSAKVAETPTVLVFGLTAKAKAITGFTTGAELDQAVRDALKTTRQVQKAAG